VAEYSAIQFHALLIGLAAGNTTDNSSSQIRPRCRMSCLDTKHVAKGDVAYIFISHQCMVAKELSKTFTKIWESLLRLVLTLISLSISNRKIAP